MENSIPTVNEEGQDLPMADKAEEQETGSEQPSYPGVVNRVLKAEKEGEPSIILNYPEFGHTVIDASIEGYIKNLAAGYQKDVIDAIGSDEEKPSSFDMWDMGGTYSITRPQPDVVSVMFNVYSYSGGAHGNLLIRCLNYDLSQDKAIDFAYLFKDTEKALHILSQISSEKLHKELGAEAEDDMIESGTTPDADNFANLNLLPDGLNVEFQPYQVGPWSIGPQHVHFSLRELSEAEPNPQIWPILKNGESIDKSDSDPKSATEDAETR